MPQQPVDNDYEQPFEFHARYHQLKVSYSGSLSAIRWLLARAATLGGLASIGGLFL